MPKTEPTDHHPAITDTAEILAWRNAPTRPRGKEPLVAAAFTAGSAAVFFVLAACVMSAVFVYYQGH